MVDIQPTSTQQISDDQELAKVLAGVSGQADSALQFEETPAATQPQDQSYDPVVAAAATTDQPTATNTSPEPAVNTADWNTGGDDLTPIKTEAINELRPLVDKLSLPPEEKFDAYLLLLRSTDDRTLIAPAHAAAREITDEAKKAQALLDIIKEIDFLSQPPQTQ